MSQQAENRRQGWLDISLGLFLLIICGLTIYNTSLLPKFSCDPLGSAFWPSLFAWIIAALTVIVLIRGIGLVIANPRGSEKLSPMITPLAIYSLLILLAYIMVMYFELVDYRIASILFITSLGYLLSHFSLRGLLISFIISLITTFSTYYIFTKILVLALP